MFTSLWNAIITQIRGLEQVLYQAMSSVGYQGITSFMILTIFLIYVAWKIYEIWIVTADDTFVRKLWFIFKEYRRIMIVYLLVIAAPVLVQVAGNTAIGFTQAGRNTITNGLVPIFGDLDQLLANATPLFSLVPVTLAVRAGGDGGGNDPDFVLAGQRVAYQQKLANSAIVQQQALLADAQNRHLSPQVINAYQNNLNQMTTTLGLSTAVAMGTTGQSQFVVPGMQDYSFNSWKDAERNAIFNALYAQWCADFQSATGQQVSGQTDAPVSAELLAASANPPASLSKGGRVILQFMVQGGWGGKDGLNGNWLIDQLSRETNQVFDAREAERNGTESWVPTLAWKALGFIGVCICVIGILACGINVFKSAYGVVLYCVGFLATVIFAVTLATPMAPAFMLCFISDKTESYGRNFVNFMFGAVFASMGLMLMAKAVVAAWTVLGQTLVVQGLLSLNLVLQNTDTLSSFAMACLGCAATLIVAGMAFTFVSDFVKKGASVGTGMFTGHFPS